MLQGSDVEKEIECVPRGEEEGRTVPGDSQEHRGTEDKTGQEILNAISLYR